MVKRPLSPTDLVPLSFPLERVHQRARAPLSSRCPLSSGRSPASGSIPEQCLTAAAPEKFLFPSKPDPGQGLVPLVISSSVETDSWCLSTIQVMSQWTSTTLLPTDLGQGPVVAPAMLDSFLRFSASFNFRSSATWIPEPRGREDLSSQRQRR